MKKILVVLGAIGCFGLGGTLGVIAASGTPEVNRANATLSLQGNIAPKTCTGEDSIGYETFTGSYSGSETQVFPDGTDYALSGPVSITGIAWTINLSTKRGVFTGVITHMNTAGALLYRGSLTLITQGVPAAGAIVPARGWINAKFMVADDGVPPATSPNDDSLIANTEFKLSPTMATGQFGDLANGGTLGYKDFSVVTNVAPTPAQDGTC